MKNLICFLFGHKKTYKKLTTDYDGNMKWVDQETPHYCFRCGKFLKSGNKQ